MVLKCSNDCHIVCDFCIFYDFNSDEDGVYTGNGVCWHPDHPQRKYPTDGCDDFICSAVIDDFEGLKTSTLRPKE